MKKRRFFPLILLLSLVMSMAAPAALALEVPQLNGQAAVLVDLDAGRVLYGYNMDAERAPASLTKVMTVLLALEAVDSGRVSLDEMIVAQDDCLEGLEEDSSTSGIAPGISISMKDLLYCALLQSANEACNIIGRYIAGSISGFVDQMNRKAEQLGCQHTHFVNDGNPGSQLRSTDSGQQAAGSATNNNYIINNAIVHRCVNHSPVYTDVPKILFCHSHTPHKLAFIPK